LLHWSEPRQFVASVHGCPAALSETHFNVPLSHVAYGTQPLLTVSQGLPGSARVMQVKEFGSQ
jgi:hypothetical protein